MKCKLTIESNISERDVIEQCFNMKHSGYEYILLLSIYALEQGWNYDKLMYYLEMLK